MAHTLSMNIGCDATKTLNNDNNFVCEKQQDNNNADDININNRHIIMAVLLPVWLNAIALSI